MTATGAQAIMPGKVRATDRRAVLWPPYGEAFWGLRGLRLFSNLSQAELRELSPLLRRETHPRGGFLFHMGDKADRLYFLERGTVKAVVLSPDGDERILDVFRAGDLFGELFFMTVARRIFPPTRALAARMSRSTACSTTSSVAARTCKSICSEA